MSSAMPVLLILGTRNRKKRKEIVQILESPQLAFGDLNDWPDAPEIDEDGSTFQENASKKATVLARALGHWVLGEDSGLVVPSLGGAPGIYSARYAGEQGNDEANNDKLLRELEAFPDEKRGAYYVCTAALSDPQGKIHAVVEGRCHGRILRERHGAGGFGYDPLFLIPEYHQTFGELSAVVKDALSHRARALDKLKPLLRVMG
jgi:XTP/dITP diphosphohydrolase